MYGQAFHHEIFRVSHCFTPSICAWATWKALSQSFYSVPLDCLDPFYNLSEYRERHELLFFDENSVAPFEASYKNFIFIISFSLRTRDSSSSTKHLLAIYVLSLHLFLTTI